MNTTTDLFGDLPEPPAAQPAAPTLARLKVQKTAQGKLSPAQQRFNKLLARVDNLRRHQQELEQMDARLRGPHLQAVAQWEQKTTQVQADMLLFLHGRLQQRGLTAAQKKSAHGIVCGLLQAVMQRSDDPQWAALHAQYFSEEDQQQHAEQLEEAKQQVLQAMEDMLGRPVSADHPMDSPEDLLRALAREMEAERAAQAERQAARRARRGPTAKEQKAQAQAQDAQSALRTIFRQLASALHPDREPDPQERQRKTALMSQANAAYERGDLGELLRLQLQAEQIDEDSIARMADEKLAALSLLLKEQVSALEYELDVTQARISSELGVHVVPGMKEHVLKRLLDGEQQSMQDTVESMGRDLVAVAQDDAELKRWLREQTAMARQHAREEEFMMEMMQGRGAFY